MPGCSDVNGTQQSSAGSGKAYFPLFTGEQTIQVDALGIWVNGAASPTVGIWRAAIYACTTHPTDLYPGALIADSGNLSATAAGLIVGTFTAVNLSPYTLYWIATKREQTASSTVVYIATTQKVMPYQPYQTINSGSGLLQSRQTPLRDANNVGGAWVDPAVAGAEPNTGVTNAPIAFFRVTGVV
jgi:hypothetical protein